MVDKNVLKLCEEVMSREIHTSLANVVFTNGRRVKLSLISEEEQSLHLT